MDEPHIKLLALVELYVNSSYHFFDPDTVGNMKVYISYRHDYSRHVAGRLRDTNQQTLPNYDIFMNSDRIPTKVDFRSYFDEFVSSCDLILAIIGLKCLSIKYPRGRRWLEDPNDFVKLVIAAALSGEVKVIPVIVNNVEMPQEEKLPEELKAIACLNAIPLRYIQTISATLRKLFERSAK